MLTFPKTCATCGKPWSINHAEECTGKPRPGRPALGEQPMTAAQRQAAYRARQKKSGLAKPLLQVELHADVLAALDDYASANNTNRARLIESAIHYILAGGNIELPSPK